MLQFDTIISEKLYDFNKINFYTFYFFYISVVNQKYKVQVHDEYVMTGNTAVLKCQVSIK